MHLVSYVYEYIYVYVYLHTGDYIDSELVNFLADTTEIQTVQSKKNRPVYMTNKLSREIQSMLDLTITNEPNYTVIRAQLTKAFEESIHQLNSVISICERIVTQPVPLSYARHLSRFLSLFMYSLPLILIPSLGWLTVPTMAVTFWAFVSIQEKACYIEQPFNKDIQMIPLNTLIVGLWSDLSGKHCHSNINTAHVYLYDMH